MVRHLLGHPRASDLGLDPGDVLARFRDLDPRWRHLYRVALEIFAEGRGADVAVEKTPAHLVHVPRILQWYPDARVILLVRDGRDAVLSMMAAGFTHDDLRRHACNWRRMACMGEQLAARFPRHLCTVRFEHLIARPEQILRELHDFLGVPFDPVQLQDSSPSPAVPAWEAAWKARATRPVDPARAGAWRHLATDHQRWALHAVMGDALTRLGYPDAHLEDCPLPARARHLALARLWRAALHPAVRPITATAFRRIRTIA